MKKAATSKKPLKPAVKRDDKPLSPQRELFAQELVKCGNQSEAFRLAYPSSKAWPDKLVWSHASQLLRDGKVKVRVRQLRAETEKKLGMSREKWLQKWVTLASHGQPGDRMRALENIGKALGYYAPEKHELSVAGTIVHVDLSDRIAVLDLELEKALGEIAQRRPVVVEVEAVEVGAGDGGQASGAKGDGRADVTTEGTEAQRGVQRA